MSTKLVDKTAAEAAGRPMAAYVTVFEDDKTRITQWTMKPGEQTGWHSQGGDAASEVCGGARGGGGAIGRSGGRLHLDYADGSQREIDYAPGNILTGSAPVEHNAISVGDETIHSMEIEYKF